MHKTFYYLAWVTILSALVLMSTIGFWLFFPYKTTVFKDSILKVENTKVKAGGDLVYYVDYCKYTDIIPEITKTFVDGIIYVVPPAVSTTKTGCGRNKIQVTIPQNLPSGVYHLDLTYRYKVNPLRTIDISIETENFTVTK